jgi:ribosome recycling factor
MEHAIEDFRRKLGTVRTGRASTGLLDSITVDYYGTQMPLNQVATVHAPEASLLTVQPFDPSQLAVIEKAIRSSDSALTPPTTESLFESRSHR